MRARMFGEWRVLQLASRTRVLRKKRLPRQDDVEEKKEQRMSQAHWTAQQAKWTGSDQRNSWVSELKKKAWGNRSIIFLERASFRQNEGRQSYWRRLSRNRWWGENGLHCTCRRRPLRWRSPTNQRHMNRGLLWIDMLWGGKVAVLKANL